MVSPRALCPVYDPALSNQRGLILRAGGEFRIFISWWNSSCLGLTGEIKDFLTPQGSGTPHCLVDGGHGGLYDKDNGKWSRRPSRNQAFCQCLFFSVADLWPENRGNYVIIEEVRRRSLALPTAVAPFKSMMRYWCLQWMLQVSWDVCTIMWPTILSRGSWPICNTLYSFLVNIIQNVAEYAFLFLNQVYQNCMLSPSICNLRSMAYGLRIFVACFFGLPLPSYVRPVFHLYKMVTRWCIAAILQLHNNFLANCVADAQIGLLHCRQLHPV